MKIGELIIWIVMVIIVTWFSFALVTIHNKIDANTENIDANTERIIELDKRIGELTNAGALSSQAGLLIIAELQELIAELERKGVIESDESINDSDVDLYSETGQWIPMNMRDV